MTTTKHYASLAALLPALFLTACSQDTDYNFQQGIDNQAANFTAANPPTVLFDPSAGVLPFPNFLLLDPATGRLGNVPADESNPADPALALRQMGGFSTSSPLVAGVSRRVDGDTLVIGSTVRVFEIQVDPATGGVAAVTGELDATQITAVATDNQIVILPLQPLAPNTFYMAVLTNGIKGPDEAALGANATFGLTVGSTPLTNEAVAPLEPLRQLTGSMVAAAASAQPGVAPESIASIWTFNTQSTREVLQAVADAATAQNLTVEDFNGSSTRDLVGELPGFADVYTGTLEVPYYQTAVGESGDPSVALNGFWNDANGDPATLPGQMPAMTAMQTVPVLMTVPNDTTPAGAQPPNGWPIAIFQHGITANRTNIIGIADAMAAAGYAVIAIDHPVHGLIPTDSSPFMTDFERTMGIDVINNETRLPGPDGVIDPSGAHYYNLQNLANSRDNLRQSIADLLTLSASLGGLTGAPIDASTKSFIGHSLGGIVGTTFISLDSTIGTATLAMPGGGIAQLLANSASFGPSVNGGLAAAGIEVGSAQYQQFLTVTQTVIDSGDPINHAAFVDLSTTPVHLIEVLNDQSIPNAVASAPLSGTTPLAQVMGLPLVTGTTSGSGHVRFNVGGHASILRPEPADQTGMDVLTEMQTQTRTFAASRGTSLLISNPALVAAP